MEFVTGDLILRTVTENDMKEIARMWEYPNEITIDEKYRNRGYATQCAIELINYAFEAMEYDVIYGGCARSNVESYRVMQKAGMAQNSFYENGDYIFSMDREAFLNSKREVV